MRYRGTGRSCPTRGHGHCVADVSICTHKRAEFTGLRQLAVGRDFLSIHENPVDLLHPKMTITEFATYNPNDEEFEKRLGAIVHRGITTIIIDNANGRGRNPREEAAAQLDETRREFSELIGALVEHQPRRRRVTLAHVAFPCRGWPTGPPARTATHRANVPAQVVPSRRDSAGDARGNSRRIRQSLF